MSITVAQKLEKPLKQETSPREIFGKNKILESSNIMGERKAVFSKFNPLTDTIRMVSSITHEKGMSLKDIGKKIIKRIKKAINKALELLIDATQPYKNRNGLKRKNQALKAAKGSF